MGVLAGILLAIILPSPARDLTRIASPRVARDVTAGEKT
jgi:hypothetical protein